MGSGGRCGGGGAVAAAKAKAEVTEARGELEAVKAGRRAGGARGSGGGGEGGAIEAVEAEARGSQRLWRRGREGKEAAFRCAMNLYSEPDLEGYILWLFHSRGFLNPLR